MKKTLMFAALAAALAAPVAFAQQTPKQPQPHMGDAGITKPEPVKSTDGTVKAPTSGTEVTSDGRGVFSKP